MTVVLNRVMPSPRPEALPGHEWVQRFWDPASEHWTAKILPGECYVTRNDEAVVTVLGSCVAACLRDTRTGIGGMNHFMLPEDHCDETCEWRQADGAPSARFGTHAMQALLDQLLRLGARRDQLELKLFGGGRILQSLSDVGARNIAFVRGYAESKGLHVAAEDLGGIVPRHLRYFPTTGRVLLKRLRAVLDPVIAEGENRHRAALAAQSYESDVELFE